MKKVDGFELGEGDIIVYVIVLVGYNGFVFIVYKNFCVIMCWNNLEFYVIVVGVLVDCIVGVFGIKVMLFDLFVYNCKDIIVF